MQRPPALNFQNSNEVESDVTCRRSILKRTFAASCAALVSPAISAAVDDDLTRGGVPLTPFNGLAFQYRGNSNVGLDASSLDEPSISYAEFLDRMDKGEVTFVEFLAPNGDKAYATLKPSEGETQSAPIRIGEGKLY